MTWDSNDLPSLEAAWVNADKAVGARARGLHLARGMTNHRAVACILREYANGGITCDEAQRRLERAAAPDVVDAVDGMMQRLLGFLGLSGHSQPGPDR
jgi:hypothetical protein